MRLLPCAVLFAAACTGVEPSSDPQALSFGGSFSSRHAPWGGFGGGACTARRTPVVFLHGNGEDATTWFRRASDGGPSVVETFRAAGYSPCELFGLTYLSPAQQAWKEGNTHDAAKAARVAGFLDDVRRYTRQQRLDVIGHSLGVTVALHALERAHGFGGVRRFVAIAGGLRGLASCLSVGFANPAIPACGSQNVFDPDLFGFHPLGNWRMEPGGFRDLPLREPGTTFYSLRAGESDEILCPSCESALFVGPARAQLDVGQGHPVEQGHDDSTGVGHLRARSDTGAIQVNMLSSDCVGAECCRSYGGGCRQ